MHFIFNITTTKVIDATTEQEARKKLKKVLINTNVGETDAECHGAYDPEDCSALRRIYSLDTQEYLYYKPTCPIGYDDCIWDPAYTQVNNPDSYKEQYGDKTPYEAADSCRKKVEKDPEEEHYCYDNEDKQQTNEMLYLNES